MARLSCFARLATDLLSIFTVLLSLLCDATVALPSRCRELNVAVPGSGRTGCLLMVIARAVVPFAQMLLTWALASSNMLTMLTFSIATASHSASCMKHGVKQHDTGFFYIEIWVSLR